MQVLKSSMKRTVEISGIKYHIDMSTSRPEDGTEPQTSVKVDVEENTHKSFSIDIKGQYPADMAVIFAELQRMIGIVAGCEHLVGAYHHPAPPLAARPGAAPVNHGPTPI